MKKVAGSRCSGEKRWQREAAVLMSLSALLAACGPRSVDTIPEPCQAALVAISEQTEDGSNALRSLSGSFDLTAWLQDGPAIPDTPPVNARLVLRAPTPEDSALAFNEFGNRTIIPAGGSDLLTSMFGEFFSRGAWRYDSTLSPVLGGYNDRTGEFGLTLEFTTHSLVTMTIDAVAGDFIKGSWKAAWADVSGSTERMSGGVCGRRSR